MAVSHRPWYVRLSGFLTLPVGVAAYVVVLLAMLATQNINLFPTLLLIGSLTVPLSVLLLAYTAGDRPDGHVGLVALTAVVGGIIGTTAAGVLEYATLRTLPWLGMLAVGVIEEAVKLFVPLVVFLAARRRTEGFGVVLGIASGMGFAVLETMGYGLTALIQTSGNVGAVDATLLLRALLAPAGHVAWSGIAAAALWRIGSQPPRRFAVGGFIVAYVGVVILHALWDGTSSLILHVAIAVVSLGILIVLIVTRFVGGHARRPRQPLPPPPPPSPLTPPPPPPPIGGRPWGP